MQRTWAIVDRELRRFRRSPMLIVISMVFPIVQLVVLGYAFGGNVKHLKVAIVDQDHGLPAVRIRELASAVSSGARTFDTIEYADPGVAMEDLRNGVVNGIVTIPPDFSRRVLAKNQPRIALIEDNTDSFVSGTLAATLGNMVGAYRSDEPSTTRVGGDVRLDVVEVYPYVPYVQYLLPGSIVMSIFMMVMIALSDDTTVKWTATPGAAKYRIWWRDTTSPYWQGSIDVPAGTTEFVVKDVVLDDHFFGVAGRVCGRLCQSDPVCRSRRRLLPAASGGRRQLISALRECRRYTPACPRSAPAADSDARRDNRSSPS